jgi:hypothetical protein
MHPANVLTLDDLRPAGLVRVGPLNGRSTVSTARGREGLGQMGEEGEGPSPHPLPEGERDMSTLSLEGRG